MHSFSWEVEHRILRADGFVVISNLAYNTLRLSFVEMDIAKSGNTFDKVSKYNALYQSREYARTWWAPLATGFPEIIIVTTGPPKKIRDKVN